MVLRPLGARVIATNSPGLRPAAVMVHYSQAWQPTPTSVNG